MPRKRKKFSPQFERDYQFYFSKKDIFTFAGTNIKNDFGIQLPDELEKIDEENNPIPFTIPYSSTGKTAKVCFYILDSEGKNSPCSEPQLLIDLLTCKSAVNLQIKTWAQGRAEYTIPKYELEEYMTYYECPDWVLKAIENQKDKIIKEWNLEKKWEQHSFYKDALTFHLMELLKDNL